MLIIIPNLVGDNARMPKITQWTSKTLEHHPKITWNCLKWDIYDLSEDFFPDFLQITNLSTSSKMVTIWWLSGDGSGQSGDGPWSWLDDGVSFRESSSKTNLTFTTEITCNIKIQNSNTIIFSEIIENEDMVYRKDWQMVFTEKKDFHENHHFWPRKNKIR